jgi:hypothetical protein
MVPGGVMLHEIEARSSEVEEGGVCELGIEDELFQIRDSRGVDE